MIRDIIKISLACFFIVLNNKATCDRRFIVLPDKQATIDGATPITAVSSASLIHCATVCTESDCFVANFESNSSVCLIWPVGTITLNPRSRTTVIRSVKEIRLVNGPNEKSGRLEILNGEWGTVCNDHFDNVDATVVCKSLGYSSGTFYGSAHYGQGQGNVWLDNLECTGEELYLEDCPHAGWGVHNCGHYEDVGVECSNCRTMYT